MGSPEVKKVKEMSKLQQWWEGTGHEVRDMHCRCLGLYIFQELLITLILKKEDSDPKFMDLLSRYKIF